MRKASSTYELECLAVLFGTEKLRKYIEHKEFILKTDNQALSWLLSHPRQLGNIGRWVVKLSALKFQVRHIRGKQNIVANTLSQMFEGPLPEAPNLEVCHLNLTAFPLAFQEMGQLQREDPVLAGIIAKLEGGDNVRNYSLSKGTLYCHAINRRGQKLVVPTAAIPMVLAYFHASPLGGHLGVFKTINKIRSLFIWKGMDKEIHSRVHVCHTCALSKPAQNSRLGLLGSVVAQRPMQKIFIDYVGKFPQSKVGISAILVCAKFVWMIPIRQATTKATIKALQDRIFSSFSVPEILVSDNAQCFTSKEFQQFCFELGVKYVTTSPHYLQPSHAEQFNRNLRAALIAYHSGAHATWDQNLTWLQLAFNTAQHESTKAAPFLVIFPFQTGSPFINQWKINELLPERFNRRALKNKLLAVKQNLLKSQTSMALRYNHNCVPQPFKVGI